MTANSTIPSIDELKDRIRPVIRRRHREFGSEDIEHVINHAAPVVLEAFRVLAGQTSEDDFLENMGLGDDEHFLFSAHLVCDAYARLMDPNPKRAESAACVIESAAGDYLAVLSGDKYESIR